MCLFFILGIVPREKQIGTESRYCPFDERETPCTIYERRNWFMFFFIPIFPVGGKQIVTRCNVCGMEPTQARMERDFRVTRVCPNCGSEVGDDSSYCQNCGHRL